MFIRKIKEMQSLIDTSRKDLEKAENRASELKNKNTKANILISVIEVIICEKGYGTILDRFDAIKKLVADYQSNN